MPTTRAKRQAQQQSGLPPSPQVVLPEPSRKRTRAPRAKKTEKPPEATESSTTEHVEDSKSEIETVSLNPAAHPVPEVVSTSPNTIPPGLASHSVSPIAHPVPARLSDTATVFASILHNHSLESVAHIASAESPHNSNAHVAPAQCPGNSITQALAADPLRSPGTIPPAIPNTVVQTLVSPARLADSATPYVSPSLTPTPRVPAVPQTRLHLWVDAAPEDLAATEPSNAPSFALAIPSSLLPEILALIAQRPVTTRNELTKTLDSTPGSSSPLKRKLSDDAEISRPARRLRFGDQDHTATPAKTSRTSRQALSESNGQPKSALRATNINKRRTKLKRLDRYDSKGNIQLGGSIEVTDDSDDEGFPFPPPLKENKSIAYHYTSLEGTMTKSNPYADLLRPCMDEPEPLEDAIFDLAATEREDQAKRVRHLERQHEQERQREQDREQERERELASATTEREGQSALEAPLEPATPHPRGWGFGSILNSARSVTRFIPLLGARHIVAETQVAEDVNCGVRPTATPAQALAINAPQTEPRPRMHSTESGNAPVTELVRPSKHPSTSKAALKSRQQVSDERKRRAERQFIREQIAFVEEEDARKAQEDKDQEAKRRQAVRDGQPMRNARRKIREAAIRQATIDQATTPGGKRKRQPSPDAIPNPPGASYGMDLDYFGCSSSDEEEEQTTPTKQPLRKKSRLSEFESTPDSIIGDPHRARPYTGVYFADSSDKYHGGNIFDERASSANAASRAADAKPAVTSPTPNESAKAAAARAATMGAVREGVKVTEAELMARGYLDNAPRIQIPGPPPKPNRSGMFTVPDASDSDSDPEDTEPEVAISSPSQQPVVTSSAAPSQDKSGSTWTQPPPPAPNPSHAALPPGSSNEDQLNDAIAKARANAMKHAPKKTSSLRQSSRLSSPKVVIDSMEKEPAKGTGVASKEVKDAGERQLQARTPSSLSVERAETPTPATSAYEEWQNLADPVVSQMVESTWTKEDTKVAEDDLEAELDAYLASNESGQVEGGLVASDYSEQLDAYAAFAETADPAVIGLLEEEWTGGDEDEAMATFEEEFDAFSRLQEPSAAA